MAPAVEHKGNERHGWSGSPVRNRHSSPRRRNSPRRERSPAPRKSSPGRVRSPPRTSHSQKNRSPVNGRDGRVPDRARSPRNARPHSPVRSGSSRSLSPRSKRLRQAQADREVEKLEDKEHRRSSGKEDRDRGRPRDREEVRDASHDRKSVSDKIDGHLSRYSKHDRSISPERRSHRRRHSSSSPSRASKSASRDEAGAKPRESENVRRGEGDDIDNDSVAKMKAAETALNEKEKQKPSFELSGKLAEETNKVRGVTLLFSEPADARKPDIRWRLYVFKLGEVLNEPLYVHRQSCYLFGRERRVADIPTDHPSCSKQHAVIQYRLVEKEQPDGLMSKQVRPYIMDLGSTNGTFINDNRIEPQRYYELFEKDTIKFGNSSREYVLLHENSTS